jgi:serine/threonine protein phosphatase 1
MRTYAIGDIHGYSSELDRAHRLIAKDRARAGDDGAPVVHIGDLCDRGPDTRGVIDRLLAGMSSGEPWIVLKGNHDRMMELFLRESETRDHRLRPQLDWLHPNLGGSETLASYGVDTSLPAVELHRDARAKVPEAHRAFIADLPLQYERGACFFAHAGIHPDVPLDRQDEDDLVWIREPFLSDTRDHGKLIVHGHTAIDAATHYGNRLNIDSRAGYGEPISAVVLEGRDAWLLTEDGRETLPHV